MSGDGADDVGSFLIKGRYDSANRDCHWTKTYVGAHDVFYKGFRDGKGIWGTWEIGSAWKGGFHIWPLGEEPEDEASHAIEESAPPIEIRATKRV